MNGCPNLKAPVENYVNISGRTLELYPLYLPINLL